MNAFGAENQPPRNFSRPINNYSLKPFTVERISFPGEEAISYTPIIILDDGRRLHGGVFETERDAALAFDLIKCRVACEKKSYINTLRLNNSWDWLTSFEEFCTMHYYRLDDYIAALRTHPETVIKAFDETKAPWYIHPQATGQYNANNVHEASYGPHIKLIPESLPVNGFLSGSQQQGLRGMPRPHQMDPEALPLQPLPILPLLPPTTSPAYNQNYQQQAASSPSIQASMAPRFSAFRSPWATFPVGTNNQSVAISPEQIASGVLSMPLDRYEIIFGSVTAEGSSVVLVNSAKQTRFTVPARKYPGHPDKVFFQRLKEFFQDANVHHLNVLCFQKIDVGWANVIVWENTHENAIKFWAHPFSGYCDATPPVFSGNSRFFTTDGTPITGTLNVTPLSIPSVTPTSIRLVPTPLTIHQATTRPEFTESPFPSYNPRKRMQTHLHLAPNPKRERQRKADAAAEAARVAATAAATAAAAAATRQERQQKREQMRECALYFPNLLNTSEEDSEMDDTTSTHARNPIRRVKKMSMPGSKSDAKPVHRRKPNAPERSAFGSPDLIEYARALKEVDKKPFY